MSDEFTFRLATFADVERLSALDARCFPPEVAYTVDFMEYLMTGENFHTLVAERDGLAGFITVAMIEKHAGEIVTIDVEARFRRQHLGSTLMDRGEEWIREHGGEWMYLEVDQDNIPGLRMYESRGYEVVREFLENDVERFLMMKAL